MIRFPGPGCVVEFMQGNRAQQAVVLEEQSGSLRLYTLARRETKMPVSRLLPWYGPILPMPSSRQDMHNSLEQISVRREELCSGLDAFSLWDMAKDEISHASARWFAELVWQDPDFDQVAAVGHALLECKTHLKFTPPDFELYSQEKAESRVHEAQAAQERASFLSAGRGFALSLWESHLKQNRNIASLPDLPPELEQRLEEFLRCRMADPEDHETASLWREFSKSFPDDPFLPFFLLRAWGKVPAHYNFYLDRIGYQTEEDWYAPYQKEIESIIAQNSALELEFLDLPFVSVDTCDTEDLDDAFYLKKDESGNFILYLAIACPSYAWNFGGELDRAVLRRASSIYLPEGSLHMMPEQLGINGYSLRTGVMRPALLAAFKLSPGGEVLNFDLSLKRVNVAANLSYEECEAILDANFAEDYDLSKSVNPAAPYKEVLDITYELGLSLQQKRIAQGAVIIKRPDPKIVLSEVDGEVRVDLLTHRAPDLAPMMVGELMVLLNSQLAIKAVECSLPLIYRTQHVTLPKDYAGIWDAPEDIARIVKALPPASIEGTNKPHAGLGLDAYATISSPLRRYTDLFNQGQVVSYLRSAKPLFTQEQLLSMLPLITARSESATLVQKQRPRYWKLLYFKQQGDKKWYEAVISDENDAFVTVCLQVEQLQLRCKRSLFGDKAIPGQSCRVRIGKVNLLSNDIQIVAVEDY